MVFHEIITEADPASWHVDDFVDANGTAVDLIPFTSSKLLALDGPLHCRVSVTGCEVDFTLAGFGAPVVSRGLSQQLLALAPRDVQLVPLIVDGSATEFDLLNVLHCVDALDDQKSIGGRWPEGSPTAGQWLYVARAALNAEVTDGHALFRVHGWPLPIFCTDAVRETLEPQEWTGLLFRSTL